MLNLPAKKELGYSARYTANVYLDSLLTIPLAAARGFYTAIGGIAEKIHCERPEWTDWDKVKDYTPLYKQREKIRAKWDTEQGVKFLKSNVVGTALYFFAGKEVADITYDQMKSLFPQDVPIMKELTTSMATVISGYLVGNASIIIDYTLISNRDKHKKENGNLDYQKIAKTGENFLEGALSFDIPFFSGKMLMQTYMMSKGIAAGTASLIYDFGGIAAWNLLVFHIGMRKNIFEPESMPDYFRKKDSWTDKMKKWMRKRSKSTSKAENLPGELGK